MAKSDEEPSNALTQPVLCPPWLVKAHQHVVGRHSQGNLPQALLLSGPADIGKRWFAENLVRTLACLDPKAAHNAAGVTSACGKCTSCAQLDAGSSAEFRYLQPAGKSHTVRIDPIRSLVEWLQLAASAGRYRIALVAGADTMNRAAANALLKTLEEPADGAVCLLVADKPAQLPPTLISRCQRLALTVEDQHSAIEWLGSELPRGMDASVALHGAHGAPLRAVRESNPDWLKQQVAIDAAWWHLLMHKRSVGSIVESLKEVPLAVCLSRFLTLSAAAIRHRQGAGQYSPLEMLSDEQMRAVERVDSVQWFTIHDQLQRLYRIDSASFKTQTVLEGFLADTRLKING